MSMETHNLLLPLFLFLLCVVALSSDFPSQGCYWTQECLHKMQGDCGGLIYNQSTNCYGNCQGPKYSPCSPDHTHFYCCVAGSPIKVKDGCTKCENKIDGGDEFVCCTDCTYPDMIYGDASSGYCKTGADLISQPKPKEVFRWVAGPWLRCSTPCGGGIRSRRVECFAVIEDTSFPDYPVYDDHCSNQEKPATREPCNLQSCVTEVVNSSKEHTGHPAGRRTKSSKWIVTLIVLLVLGLVAVGFAGFIFYTRRRSSLCNNEGYVYIMMEGFS